MSVELISLLLLAPIAFAGALVYGLTGVGSGLITVPLASQWLDLPFVLAVFALLDTNNAVRMSLSMPRAIVRAEALRLVPCCVLGVLLGVTLLVSMPVWIAMLALACFVLAYALYSLVAWRNLPVIGQGWAYLAGLAGGISSALFGAGGPPYAIYLSMRPYDKEQIRSTLAVTSLVSIVTRVVAFAVAGLLSSRWVWLTALALLPFSWLALWWADRLQARWSREQLVRAISLMLFLAGVSLMVRALRVA